MFFPLEMSNTFSPFSPKFCFTKMTQNGLKWTKIEILRAHGEVNKTNEQRMLSFKPRHIHIRIQLSDRVHTHICLYLSPN